MAGYKGKQGRKPAPTAIKELRGTVRPDRANKNEPKPEALERPPSCPVFITGEARLEWRRMTRVLIGMRVLTKADLEGLQVWCQVYGRWREAEANLAKFGLVVKDPKGWMEPNPFLKVANDCIKQMRALMSEFGITPSSRTRVSQIGPNTDEEESFEGWMRRRQN